VRRKLGIDLALARLSTPVARGAIPEPTGDEEVPVRARYILTLPLVALLTLITFATPAHAAGPSLTVTPNVGLLDGQAVVVTGTGFQPGQFVVVTICPTEQLGVYPPDSVEAALYLSTVCAFGNNSSSTHAGADGTFVAPFTVTRNNTTTSPGPPFPPAGPAFQCGLAPADCVILAGGFVGTFVNASAPISFASEPTLIQDCQHGGWRHHVDDRDLPFKNQGNCVRFVLNHTG
jgi:hypothetical protein